MLTTDVSATAIGNVVEQVDDTTGVLRPLVFFSRALNKCECKYSTIEREALAIVYGFKNNRPLILGYPVLIRTDHTPLVWLLTVSKPSGYIACWQIAIIEFNISI